MTRNSPTPETVALHVPFRVVKRGGRKEMVLPDGAAEPRRTDRTLVKALARAFRWKRMLDSGKFATIAELAEAEGIARSYLTRILRLTFLAPDIIEAILDGSNNSALTTETLQASIAENWKVQRHTLFGASTQSQPSIFNCRWQFRALMAV